MNRLRLTLTDKKGATGSHLITTVNCHSGFLLPCCPPHGRISHRGNSAAQHPTSYLFPVHKLDRLLFRFPLSHHHPSTNFPSPHFSHLADLTPALSQPRPDITFHLRHSILPLSTSFARFSTSRRLSSVKFRLKLFDAGKVAL